jgi:hypothetical protein
MEDDRDGTPVGRADLIRIELRLSGSMPVGVATGPAGAARDFTGWMGLMSAVDALVTTASRLPPGAFAPAPPEVLDE